MRIYHVRRMTLPRLALNAALALVMSAALAGFTPASAGVQVQSVTPVREASKAILMTGFIVNKPAQSADLDDIAQGFPRELARRLEQSQQFSLRITPDFLSTEWPAKTPTPTLLAQVAKAWGVRYVIAGEVRNTGVRQTSLLFGLWTKHHRAIEVDVDVYDTQDGQLIARHRLAAEADGEGQVGKQQVFGGQGFAASPYGKVVLDVADQAAQTILQSLAGR